MQFPIMLTANGSRIEKSARDADFTESVKELRARQIQLKAAMRKNVQIRRKLEKQEKVRHRVLCRGFLPKHRSQKYAIRQFIKFEKLHSVELNSETDSDEDSEDDTEYYHCDDSDQQEKRSIEKQASVELDPTMERYRLYEADPEIGDIDGWMREARRNFERCKYETLHYGITCTC